ncbi:DUF4910 domain-containing protein [Nostoc sp.]
MVNTGRYDHNINDRQYCSPRFNLAVGCLMRSPHGSFLEFSR